MCTAAAAAAEEEEGLLLLHIHPTYVEMTCRFTRPRGRSTWRRSGSEDWELLTCLNGMHCQWMPRGCLTFTSFFSSFFFYFLLFFLLFVGVGFIEVWGVHKEFSSIFIGSTQVKKLKVHTYIYHISICKMEAFALHYYQHGFSFLLSISWGWVPVHSEHFPHVNMYVCMYLITTHYDLIWHML